jgi:ATP-binding cassette, subfamily B, bacterial PglK
MNIKIIYDNILSRHGILKKLFYLFNKREKRRFILILIIALFMGLFQTLSVLSILPFMNLLLHPDNVNNNHYLYWLYEYMGFTSNNSFIIFLGFILLFIIILGNLIYTLGIWIKTHFVFRNNHILAISLLKKYLSLPYEYFLNHHTTDLGKNILNEVNNLTQNILLAILDVIINGMIVVFILAMLLYVDVKITLCALIVFGGSYALIYYLLRKKIHDTGKERLEANQGRFKSASDALGGVKDIKILGRESFFIDRYTVHSKRFSYLQGWVAVVEQIPRYILESIAFGGIIALVIGMMIVEGNVQGIIPKVTLFAFAGYRILPALQHIFQAFTKIKFNQVVLDRIYSDMKERGGRSIKDIFNKENITKPFQFKRSIEINHISYSYPNTHDQAIKDIYLKIKRHSSVAIIGYTGSGKTTLVDIILGLLTPQTGNIIIDGTELAADDVRKWQNNLGYVPQQIYLSDDTIAHNIAFGLSDEEINYDSLMEAAITANMHEFITGQLPKGYNTIIGERGVRLSGGQRQRVGIARALYHNPEILILDEATSSLDGITEDAVLEAIDNIAKIKTLIIIAHRITTIMNCDVIYVIDQGVIVTSGTYADLIESNNQFRAMAKIAY